MRSVVFGYGVVRYVNVEGVVEERLLGGKPALTVLLQMMLAEQALREYQKRPFKPKRYVSPGIIQGSIAFVQH